MEELLLLLLLPEGGVALAGVSEGISAEELIRGTFVEEDSVAVVVVVVVVVVTVVVDALLEALGSLAVVVAVVVTVVVVSLTAVVEEALAPFTLLVDALGVVVVVVGGAVVVRFLLWSRMRSMNTPDIRGSVNCVVRLAWSTK